MAIKVNGTTVIDDNRNLVNIVSGAGASTDFGAVGTYAFAGYSSDGSTLTGVATGSTVSGGSLRAFGLRSFNTSVFFEHNSTFPFSGTWRCMGYLPAFSGSGYYNNVTVMVRIA